MAVGYISAVGGAYYYGPPPKKTYAKYVVRALIYTGIILAVLTTAASPALIKANSMVRAKAVTTSFTEQQAEIIAQVAPVTEEPLTENKNLNQALASWTAAHRGQRWGISLQDLSNNQVAGVNATGTFRSASVYKLYLLYPLLQKLPLDKFTTTNLTVNGQQKTVDQCVTAMLRVSDNPCGEAIGNYVGWTWADKMVHAAGFSSTRLSFDQPTTTANDTTRYLSALYRGKLVDQKSADYIFGILSQQKFRDGIPAGCKTNCQVMNKTGQLQGFLNDTAVVKIGEKLYIMSIFSENGRNADIANVSKLMLSKVQ